MILYATNLNYCTAAKNKISSMRISFLRLALFNVSVTRTLFSREQEVLVVGLGALAPGSFRGNHGYSRHCCLFLKHVHT